MINAAIKQVKDLIDIIYGKPNKAEGYEVKGSHDHCEGDRDKGEDQ